MSAALDSIGDQLSIQLFFGLAEEGRGRAPQTEAQANNKKNTKNKVMYRDISKYMKPNLKTSCFDDIVAFCCRFYFLVICWLMLGYQHTCSSASSDLINFMCYVITKSWHAHQKVRLDESICKEWVWEMFMDRFIELLTKPFQSLLFWHLRVFAEILLS